MRNLKNEKEEELIFSDEKVFDGGVSLVQKDKNTELVISHTQRQKLSHEYIYII